MWLLISSWTKINVAILTCVKFPKIPLLPAPCSLFPVPCSLFEQLILLLYDYLQMINL
ncbi:MAG: hypothetical protein F6K26_36335 [Moorea sp. SIO2I5]|nr:hypothetical protein [Moorena sp. SIO2I5]